MEGPIYRLESVVKVKNEDMEDFVGPLDLILHLLGKNKVEIKDIQISLLLAQYLEWMERRKTLDLEVASEFITMASHLVYIKTRMLLSLDDEEAKSEMELLVASLEAHRNRESYARIKPASELLAKKYRTGRDYLVKAPEPLPNVKSYRFLHKREDLLQAMQSLIERLGSKMPPPMSVFEHIVGREPYPVADKAVEILQRLRMFGVSRFYALFCGNRSRSEIVATFIAVLELCKAKRVRMAGSGDGCTLTPEEDAAQPQADLTAAEY